MNTLIITGGNITKAVLDQVYDDTIEYVMVVDGGLSVVDEYNKCSNSRPIKIDCIIGDFDTVDKELLSLYQSTGIKVEQFPPEKNYTDTHLALLKAIEYQASNIVIVGAIGTRLDHTMANIGLLNITLKENIPCKIIDDKNIIQMIDDKMILNAKDGKFVSILPATESVKGIYLEGFKYPLINATIRHGESIGISNEIINVTAQIRIGRGRALVIQAND